MLIMSILAAIIAISLTSIMLSLWNKTTIPPIKFSISKGKNLNVDRVKNYLKRYKTTKPLKIIKK